MQKINQFYIRLLNYPIFDNQKKKVKIKNKLKKKQDLALKELLIEAYEQGRLLVAIPFVSKVLEQSAKSKVFKPKNPWIATLLKLFVELFQSADLRLNLKFEIELLFKNLKIELKDMQPSSKEEKKRKLKYEVLPIKLN